MSKPKYHIITYGCQMNKSDSERMDAILQGVGFESTNQEAEADLILINTCSVRQSAEDRVFGKIRNFAKMKKKKPKLIVGITGCMPGRDRDHKIKDKLPMVDLYFPTEAMGQLPRWIAELRPELVNSTDQIEDYLKITPEYQSTRQAYISIQTGCNNFCTYCVVPFARGLEKNRPLADIMKEIKDLAEQGCIEITLLGQTVNSYLAPDPENFSKNNPFKHHFAALLWEVNQVDGISRLHFTAPHPIHMTDEVIDAMTLPAHLNFLHLPVQCGDNDILRKMNRRHTREQFLDVISRVKAKIPNIALGTDLIVGFCGETKEQFEATVDLYQKADFDISYTARYSVRSGTAAWRAFEDDVPDEEKKRRWWTIQKLMEKNVYEKNQKFVGQSVSVLVERHEEPRINKKIMAKPEIAEKILAKHPGNCFGNSRELKLVSFVGGPELIGQIVEVKVNKADKWILFGEILEW
ncbi:tRNA (N6-isopentenyl adenosine(37)-C2)-methylthiotransferase MiaB [Patescibacteria group bacterium]